MKKVLLGCPVADLKKYCLQPYLKRLKELTFKDFDVLLVDNSLGREYADKIREAGFPVLKVPYTKSVPERIVNSRNLLRQIVLKKGYEYFLCLEQDVIPPVDIIEQLLLPNKDIVSGVAPHLLVKDGKATEIALLAIEDKERPGRYIYFTKESALRVNGIIKVDYCAMTCLLISRKVLEKISFRFERKKGAKDLEVEWDDFCFCKDVKKEGFEIYANLAVKCDHLYYDGFCATLGNTKHIQKTPKR